MWISIFISHMSVTSSSPYQLRHMDEDDASVHTYVCQFVCPVLEKNHTRVQWRKELILLQKLAVINGICMLSPPLNGKFKVRLVCFSLNLLAPCPQMPGNAKPAQPVSHLVSLCVCVCVD